MNFHIPFMFPAISELDTSVDYRDAKRTILEESLTNSRPTSLEYWDTESIEESHNLAGSGLILGCQDGTIYVFRRPFEGVCTSNYVFPGSDSRYPSHSQKSPHGDSGSTSSLLPFSILPPTFNVTAKPRVVSGVTTEPVEALKNYVDFDDEPDKLKDILKGKNPKDRRFFADTFSDKSSPPAVPSLPLSNRKNQTPRSLLSAASSRAPSPPSVAGPGSSQNFNATDVYPWTLLYHVVTSPTSVGSPVRCVRLLKDSHFFAALHENSSLSVYYIEDGSCAASIQLGPEAGNMFSPKDLPTLQDIWIWSSLLVLYVDGSVILVAMADNINNASLFAHAIEEQSSDSSRYIFVELTTTLSDAQLRILRQMDLGGSVQGSVFCEGQEGTIVCFHMSQDGHLVRRVVRFRSLTPDNDKAGPSPNSNSNITHLPIPNPFKSMMSRSSDHSGSEESNIHGQFEAAIPWLFEGEDVGVVMHDKPFLGLRTWFSLDNGTMMGAVWTSEDLTVFEYTAQRLDILFHAQVSGLEDLSWLSPSSYALAFEHHLEVYRLKFVSSDNGEVDLNHQNTTKCTRPELMWLGHLKDHDVLRFNRHLIVHASFSGNSQQVVVHRFGSESIDYLDEAPCTLWKGKAVTANESKVLTSMLPLDTERTIQGYSDGYLRQFSLAQMSHKSEQPWNLTSSSAMKTSDQPLNGHIVGLHVVQNHRTRERYVVGGGDDGSIGFWTLSTFELVSRWTVFVTRLAKVVQFAPETKGPLRGCALCISSDSSIAVIAIDGPNLLYLIPGSSAALTRICLGGNNLLLIYDNHRARLWDAQTKELWRSMSEDKAQEMLAQEDWSELNLHKGGFVPTFYWSSPVASSYKQAAVSTLDLDLERFLNDAVAITKSISTSRDEIREILSALNRLRLILSALLTPGLNNDIDSICYGKLDAFLTSVSVGMTSTGSATLYNTKSSHDAWCISSTVTASRVLAIVAVLRTMSLFEELSEGANTAISFFTTSLGLSVGPRFKPPSLEYLGKLWFSASNELRHSIRILFEATITNLSDEESIKVAEKWQHHVPSLQPDAEKESLDAALALYICGSVASEKYSLLSINALMDISKSISLYLHDERSVYRVLAIELCSRGFSVWQHYVDAMDILRSLFGIATNIRKDSISIQNVGTQARLAVLNIASDNMPLFMGTLCLDILTPPSMEHRRSVLQILAFLIRKRPYVLQPNLPRLMEAVVKSLDPNSTSDRDLVLDTATEIVGHVVKTFPSVDFHMSSQRLAVGTNEGAVVMYDLKTAIRLYVLEGHKKPITALSFSPDGRRLVTVSLKESVVLAWKVGSSFASFFNPGAPPRQGHGGSQSFKTLNFNIGSEGEMSTAESINLVSIEWSGDRTAKVKIRQSILTFST